jgi:hypothetical protein
VIRTGTHITADYLRGLLSYDPDTGIFRWKISRCSKRPVGSIAGFPAQGYINIGIDRKTYRAHVLAWLYMTGEWPRKNLDHEDTDKSNNRFKNLREATKSQNGANMKGRSSSGYKGVYLDKRNNQWFASIQSNGKKYYLGRFSDPKLAHKAYADAAIMYNGSFARME